MPLQNLSFFIDLTSALTCFYPISFMKRYFEEDASHYLVLVDEAHNLVDRSRDMYSA